MKIMPKVIAITSVALLVISFGAEAKKERLEITACVCDEVSAGVYDCTIDFVGAAPAVLADYHAHVTAEQDGVLDSDGITPASCKAQTECSLITEPADLVAACMDAPLPDPACSSLLQEGYVAGKKPNSQIRQCVTS